MTTDNRCFANLFELVEDETGQFIPKQCSRKHKEGSNFCKIHGAVDGKRDIKASNYHGCDIVHEFNWQKNGSIETGPTYVFEKYKDKLISKFNQSRDSAASGNESDNSAPPIEVSGTKDFILRVGDGDHFRSSSSKCIWGIDSTEAQAKWFISNVTNGDRLWFVQSNSKGKIIAVATFKKKEKRVLGPLIPITQTNEDLGWTKTNGCWDTEVHYDNLYNLTSINLNSEIKGPRPIRLYNQKCQVNLPKEYEQIVRYSTISRNM
jgi:hypothetical protein